MFNTAYSILLFTLLGVNNPFDIVRERLSGTVWEIEKYCVNDSCIGGGAYCVFDISGWRTNAHLQVSYSEYSEVISIDTTFQWRLNSCTPYFVFDSTAKEGNYDVVVYSNEAGETRGNFTFTSDSGFTLSFNDSIYYKYHFKVAPPPVELLKMIEGR